MKAIQLSTRVSDEDAAFLAGLAIEGASTPSDKMRALIGEARRRQAEQGTYAGSLRQVRGMIGPAVARVLEIEVNGLPHSGVVTPMLEWLSEALAFSLSQLPEREAQPGTARPGAARAEADPLMAASDEERAQLAALEAGLVDRGFRLVELLLKLGVTERPPCYSEDVLAGHLGRALEIANVVAGARGR